MNKSKNKDATIEGIVLKPKQEWKKPRIFTLNVSNTNREPGTGDDGPSSGIS